MSNPNRNQGRRDTTPAALDTQHVAREGASATSVAADRPEGPAAEVAQLRAENAALRAQLDAAGVATPAAPKRPSFGLSEGARQDLELTGKTVDPYSGDLITSTEK